MNISWHGEWNWCQCNGFNGLNWRKHRRNMFCLSGWRIKIWCHAHKGRRALAHVCANVRGTLLAKICYFCCCIIIKVIYVNSRVKLIQITFELYFVRFFFWWCSSNGWYCFFWLLCVLCIRMCISMSSISICEWSYVRKRNGTQCRKRTE